MLQYDDSAFCFFALSILSMYLVPSWFGILSKIYRAFHSANKNVESVARTEAEKLKLNNLSKQTKGLNALKSTGFLVNFGVTILLTAIFVVLLRAASSSDGAEALKGFDPYFILGIESEEADEKVIKKAYRRLSLVLHPDKCKQAPQDCEDKFILATKAYKVLTDEDAKAKFESGGDPDGQGAFEFGIGLPTMLLDAANHNLVLFAYLFVIVGIIPYFVWRYYSKSCKYGEKDVMYDTYSWFHHHLGENTLLKSLPEVFAGAGEFRLRNLPTTPSDKEEVSSILSKVRTQMQRPKYNHPVLVKGNVLLHTHLLRKTDELSETASSDLQCMLEKSHALVDAMVTVCKHQGNLFTALNCMEFGQRIAQACWVNDSELLQLPYFTKEEVKHAENTKKKAKPGKVGITSYRQVSDDKKKGLANFTDEQKQEVLTCLNHVIPDIDVQTKVFVDDDDDDKIYEGDLCTVQVTLTRQNLDNEKTAGPVHAPKFAFPLQEAWWVVLATKDGNKILSLEKVTDPSKVVDHSIKFLAPPPGEYDFDLYIKSNGYIGLDQKLSVSFSTLDNTTLPDYQVHPDDQELDDDPTLFEQMITGNIEEDSDSDDEEDDDHDDDAPWNKTADLSREKKAALQSARKRAAVLDEEEEQSDDK